MSWAGNDITRSGCIAICVGLMTVVLLPPVHAAGVYAYPLKGQDAQQQQKDEFECTRWATNQTGFDPRNPPAYRGGGYTSAPPSSSVRSGVFGRGSYGQGGGVGDAAKGAGLGALGGAIAGDAGKGAAIGAVSGLFIGGIRRSNKAQEREAWEQQQAQTQAQQRAQYDAQVAQMRRDHSRAYSACMSARDYRVN